MSKYIDAEELIERLEEMKRAEYENCGGVNSKIGALQEVQELIASLQQEQLPGIDEHGVPGKDFIPVEWVDACEKYGKWKIVQQEQPEPSNNLVDVDAVREDFITQVYRVLDADPTNDRANAIIDAFDSLPTVSREQPEVMNIPSAGSGAMGTTPPKFKLDVKQDLPVVLEKEIQEYLEKLGGGHGGFVDDLTDDDLTGFAHHFYELGINARKK